MPNSDTASLKREITSLSDKINSRDSEVTALMNVVIETNKGVSENLVKLTQVVSNVNVLEKAQENQQRALSSIQDRVAANETNIKLSFVSSDHIKESLDEIKSNQKDARVWGGKIFATVIGLAIVGGLTAKIIG